ncbi:hypothetical protein KQI84_13175 [bacterium]|nr:hypothetical protein [bacterium]
MSYAQTAAALMAIPTAPYKEHWMLEELDRQLDQIPGLEVKKDRWGNVFARLRRGENSPGCVAYVAHLDHPGFVVHRTEGNTVHGTFEGNVDTDFFKTRPVRLFRDVDDAGIRAHVTEVSERRKETHNRAVVLEAEEDPAGAVLGMWDLEPFTLDGDHIRSRAVDDLGGTTLILETLRGASQTEGDVDVMGVFTRAEECGFRGALLVCQDDSEKGEYIPLDAWVISVETSSARPTTPIGGGGILRVGDRTSIFNPEITQAMKEISEEMAEKHGQRPLVRALMDGGTCEASAFNLWGYTSGGLCLPLGNYHNMNREAGKIDQEYISVADAEGLTNSMVQLAFSRGGESAMARLKREYEALAEDAKPKMHNWP